MDDAVLNFCLRKYRFNCVGKSTEIVRTGYENIFNASAFQAVKHLRTLRSHFRRPTCPERLFSHIDSLFYDLAFTLDVVVDGVLKAPPLEGLQQPLLPLFH